MRDLIAFTSRSWRGRIGLAFVASFVTLAIAGRWLTLYNPDAINMNDVLRGLSLRHPLGTDELGRDELSRIMQAALPMLRITVISVGSSAIAGVAVGVAAALAGALGDNLIMRLMDVLMSFPILILAIAIVAFFGPGERNVTIALAIAFLPLFARVARATALAIRSQPYVLAARSIGDRTLAIALRQILPNLMPVVIVQASLACAYAILGESALSYLGLSVQPPEASWGRMLADGKDFLQTSPHLAAVPGAMITAVVIGFNLLGDALRDYLDPTLRDKR